MVVSGSSMPGRTSCVPCIEGDGGARAGGGSCIISRKNNYFHFIFPCFGRGNFYWALRVVSTYMRACLFRLTAIGCTPLWAKNHGRSGDGVVSFCFLFYFVIWKKIGVFVALHKYMFLLLRAFNKRARAAFVSRRAA